MVALHFRLGDQAQGHPDLARQYRGRRIGWGHNQTGPSSNLVQELDQRSQRRSCHRTWSTWFDPSIKQGVETRVLESEEDMSIPALPQILNRVGG